MVGCAIIARFNYVYSKLLMLGINNFMFRLYFIMVLIKPTAVKLLNKPMKRKTDGDVVKG